MLAEEFLRVNEGSP